MWLWFNMNIIYTVCRSPCNQSFTRSHRLPWTCAAPLSSSPGTVCSDVGQYNEINIKLNSPPALSFTWIRVFSVVEEMRRNRRRHVTELWGTNMIQGFSRQEHTIPFSLVPYLCHFVQRFLCPSLFLVMQSTETGETAHITLLCWFWCTGSLSHATDLSFTSRDFQFGHMDGNDYINSLIMG